jgi:hypothetical protein
VLLAAGPERLHILDGVSDAVIELTCCHSHFGYSPFLVSWWDLRPVSASPGFPFAASAAALPYDEASASIFSKKSNEARRSALTVPPELLARSNEVIE